MVYIPGWVWSGEVAEVYIPRTILPLTYFIDLPMKMEPIVSSEKSAIGTHDAGELPKKEQITFRTRRKLKNIITLF